MGAASAVATLTAVLCCVLLLCASLSATPFPAMAMAMGLAMAMSTAMTVVRRGVRRGVWRVVRYLSMYWLTNALKSLLDDRACHLSHGNSISGHFVFHIFMLSHVLHLHIMQCT